MSVALPRNGVVRAVVGRIGRSWSVERIFGSALQLNYTDFRFRSLIVVASKSEDYYGDVYAPRVRGRIRQHLPTLEERGPPNKRLKESSAPTLTFLEDASPRDIGTSSV